MSIASEEDVVRLVRPDDAPWADTGTGVLLKKVLRFDQLHAAPGSSSNRFRPGDVACQKHRHTGSVGARTRRQGVGIISNTTSTSRRARISSSRPTRSTPCMCPTTARSGHRRVGFVIEGALLNLTPDGSVESVTDGPGILAAYYRPAQRLRAIRDPTASSSRWDRPGPGLGPPMWAASPTPSCTRPVIPSPCTPNCARARRWRGTNPTSAPVASGPSPRTPRWRPSGRTPRCSAPRRQGILVEEIGTTYDSPPTMMHTDPPQHTRYRRLVQPGFKPSMVRLMEAGVTDKARALVAPLPSRRGQLRHRGRTVSIPLPAPGDLRTLGR